MDDTTTTKPPALKISFHNVNSEWRTILWVAVPIYLIANVYLLFLGELSGVLLMFAYAVYTSLLALLTRRVTQPFEDEVSQPSKTKSILWVQIGILLTVILFTGLNSIHIPLWSNMVDWFYNLGETILPVEWFGGPGNSVANPVQYFVIPFILLLLLGAKPVDLGFGKGNKVWQAFLVWLALPFVIWIGLLATGLIPLQTLLRRIIANSFQNGFFEEFLFRGALQTRLRKIMSIPWALTVQGVLFGMWHLRANTASMDGNLLAGLALCLVSQATAGFVYGYVFHRTRNLLVPSAVHVVMNVLGQTFG